MGIRRLVGTTAVLVALAAGCGGGDDGGGDEASSEEAAPTLEEWAEQADEICAETDEAVEALEVETTDDLVERGDEVVELGEEGVGDLEELDRPDGDDGERAEAVIAALEDLVELQAEIVDEAGEGDDELALLEITVDNIEVVEDGVDAADEAGAADCLEPFEDRLEDVSRIEELFDDAGELSEVRVGDCLAGLEDDDLRPASCDDPGAQGEVRRTRLGTTGGCPDDLVGRGRDNLYFCLDLLAGPEDEDERLEVGSCILLEDAENDTVDVTELPCGDPGVTHVVVRSVRRAQSCEAGDRRFDKTVGEVATTGPGEWCAQPTA